ncbi:MAG: diguanylate cyclase (GGDEF)-like protein/PAS domain S-box-containing protein [Sulfurimonas sp.]|jgi:diguanylate cyclase (GGDEF)-like protein/PAS domain S-box-containing protein|uniref:putative bifunctional diguanylate cyclase/phosphodiesterase n=1 Tax=Sulfurimonas sp. TaxID=2022749 RepID=UPI0039E51A31
MNKILLILLFTTLGLLGNFYNVEMFFGVNQIFGSIFIFLSLYYFGISIGLIVAIAVQSSTIYLWGHPYAFYSFVLEALVVGILLKWRIKNIFIADIMYWLVIGIWLVPLFYGEFIGLADNQVELIMLKQPANGILNALLASVIIIIFSRFNILQKNIKDKITLHNLIFIVIMTSIALSLFTTANLISKNTFEHFKNQNIKKLTQVGKHLEGEVEHFTQYIFTELSQTIDIHKENNNIIKLNISSDFNRIWKMGIHDLEIVATNNSLETTEAPNIQCSENNNLFIKDETIFAHIHHNNHCYIGEVKYSLLMNFFQSQSIYPNIELLLLIDDRVFAVTRNEDHINLQKYIQESTKTPLAGNLYHLLPSKKMPKMLKWKKSAYMYEIPASSTLNYPLLIKLSIADSIDKLQEIYIYTFYVLLGIIIFAAILSFLVTKSMFVSISRLNNVAKDLPLKIENNEKMEWPDSYIQEIKDLSQNFSEVTSVLQDIFSQSKLRSKEDLKLINIVFQTTSEGIMVTDIEKNIIMVNQGFNKITGYSSEEVIGKKPTILQSGKQSEADYKRIWTAISNDLSWSGEIWNRRKDGSLYAEWLTIYKVFNEENVLTNYIGVFIDITEQKETQEKINQLAYYDTLTNLPNRQLFQDRVDHAISKTKRANTKLAMIFIDLDNFKSINDTLGHHTGDELLKHIAKCIKKSVRESDTVARLGGDEFTILVEDIREDNHVTYLAESLIKNIKQSLVLSSQEIYPSASIGICLYPDDTTSKDKLMQFADTAMYRAKENGKNRYEYYTSSMNENALRELEIESGLRYAIAHEQLELHYQPQVLHDGTIIGCEALIRWNKDGDYISPAEFIPIAENTTLMKDLEHFVIKTGASMLKSWREKGYDLVMSLNISNNQFKKESFVEDLQRIVDSVGIDYKYIDLELTERIVMDSDDSKIKLDKLNSLGFQLSIDDFGTGQSSLSYLKRFDMDKLKIDKSFVDDIPNDHQSCDIAKAIVSLSSSLNMKSVAEGVETQEQLEFLVSIGCEYFQGYYFSKALDSESFEQVYLINKQSK